MVHSTMDVLLVPIGIEVRCCLGSGMAGGWFLPSFRWCLCTEQESPTTRSTQSRLIIITEPPTGPGCAVVACLGAICNPTSHFVRLEHQENNHVTYTTIDNPHTSYNLVHSCLYIPSCHTCRPVL